MLVSRSRWLQTSDAVSGSRSIAQSWLDAAKLLARHRDILDGRPTAGDPPRALVERGWALYLLALDGAAVDAIEARGVDAAWPSPAPTSLLELVASVRTICSVPTIAALAPEPRPSRRSEKPRKRAQIDAFAQVVVPLAATAGRVVDVGSGHGHLTRELADRLGVPVLGLERDAAIADRARALSTETAAAFTVTDVLASGLALSSRDCVVGLHACGELGDVMVEAAARSGAAIALVGCCLQKRRASSRAALCRSPEIDPPLLDLPKRVLGLSNLTTRDVGVEASRAENLCARERRLALHRLLAGAGVELELGAEIEGLNRRAAHRELDDLVARAFARRALQLPSRQAIADAARWAAVQHARMRRLSLPRSLLGRVLDVFVLLDRARFLEERGFAVTIGQLFPMDVSARNLCLVARAAAAGRRHGHLQRPH